MNLGSDEGWNLFINCMSFELVSLLWHSWLNNSCGVLALKMCSSSPQRLCFGDAVHIPESVVLEVCTLVCMLVI